MKKYPWREPFQISQAQISQWEIEMGIHSDNLLLWCLEQRKLPEHAYLKWAQAHYGIPILKEGYFESALSKVRLDLDMQDAWSSALIPIGRWDHVLFLACVEPPDDVKMDGEYQLVLASWNHLKQWREMRNPNITQKKSVSSPKASISSSSNFHELDLPPVPKGSHLTLQDQVPLNVGDRVLKVETTLTHLQKNKLHEYDRVLIDIDETLNKIRVYFDKVIVFKLKNSSLFPMRWDETWKPLGDPANLRIKVDSPSIFRTCVNSLHPYHGRVIPNAVNIQFFNNWNGSQIPAHATLVPVIKEKKVIAVVMGIRDAEVDQGDRILRDSVEVAKKIGQIMVANGSNEAA